MYNKFLSIILVILTIPNVFASSDLHGHEHSGTLKPKQVVWPFEGFFGTFDRQAAQRGAQVYMEVCAACHGMSHLYYRNLKDLGFSAAEIKEIAAKKEVTDGPNEVGEMFTRSATPSDRFVSPYPNEEAARASNNGAFPADLSLIIKARHDGANYVYSLLTGYQEPPAGMTMMPGLHYNPYFEGGHLAMPAPLAPDQVTFMDGTPATVDQMARDVVIFLQWAAEPEMEHRKSMGLKVMIFLSIFTIFFFIAKKRLWRGI
jgi:ubiquinol-cytochrome c reductase cytochrome c1 subunit